MNLSKENLVSPDIIKTISTIFLYLFSDHTVNIKEERKSQKGEIIFMQFEIKQKTVKILNLLDWTCVIKKFN